MSGITSVHRRHFEGTCHAMARPRTVWCLNQAVGSDEALSRWCDVEASSSMLADADAERVRLFTDGQVPRLDRTFQRVDSHPSFAVQMARMVRADVHVGNPMSSVDFVVAAWRGDGRVTHPETCYRAQGPRDDDPPPAAVRLAAVLVFRFFSGDTLRFGDADLTQWMQYMRYAGVDHFYLYDNCHTPEECRPHANSSEVTYVRHPFSYMTGPTTPGGQIRAYAHFCNAFARRHTHAIFVDLDEYPFAPSDGARGFLSRAAPLSPRPAQTLLRSWFLTGPAETNRSARALRYLHRSAQAEPAPARTKPIVRLDAMRCEEVRNVHSFPVWGPTSVADPDTLHIRHYWAGRSPRGAVYDASRAFFDVARRAGMLNGY